MNELSIVVFTKDRPELVLRTLEYLSKIKIIYPVIIADSSINRNKEIVCTSLKKYRSLNIRYISYNESISQWDKIKDTVIKLSSEYIMLQGDDDFIIPSGLSECHEFIKRHKDYSVVGGREVRVIINSKTLKIDNIYTLPQIDLESSNPNERLFFHLSFYWPTIYSVFRRDVLYFALSQLDIFPTSIIQNWLPAELAMSAIAIIQGKYKCVKELLIIRQNNHSSSTIFSDWSLLGKDEVFTNAYCCMKEIIMKSLLPNNNNKFEANICLQRGLSNFLKNNYVNNSISNRCNRIKVHIFSLIKALYLSYKLRNKYKEMKIIIDKSINNDFVKNIFYSGYLSINDLFNAKNAPISLVEKITKMIINNTSGI